jgi:hypothetical protein
LDGFHPELVVLLAEFGDRVDVVLPEVVSLAPLKDRDGFGEGAVVSAEEASRLCPPGVGDGGALAAVVDHEVDEAFAELQGVWVVFLGGQFPTRVFYMGVLFRDL